MDLDTNLKEKTWYRILLILFGLVLVGAFFTPLLRARPYSDDLNWWALNGLFNVFGWLFIGVVIRQCIKYSVYGNKTDEHGNKFKFFSEKFVVTQLIILGIIFIGLPIIGATWDYHCTSVICSPY